MNSCFDLTDQQGMVCKLGLSLIEATTRAKTDDITVVFTRSPIMKNLFARFVKDESGATAIEYGLIAALVSVAAIAAFQTLGLNLKATVTTVSDAMK
jgi:pilus assembly protein Flp/PilA